MRTGALNWRRSLPFTPPCVLWRRRLLRRCLGRRPPPLDGIPLLLPRLIGLEAPALQCWRLLGGSPAWGVAAPRSQEQVAFTWSEPPPCIIRCYHGALPY